MRPLHSTIAYFAVVWAAGATAQTPDLSSREDDIFGAAAPATVTSTLPVAGTGTASREADIFGAGGGPLPVAEPFPEAGAAGNLDQRLEENADFLAIGGLLWLRLQYDVVDAPHPSTFPLHSPSFADVYFDARPNDRVRGYARARLRFDPTVQSGQVGSFGQIQQSTQVQLDQLWLKFDVFRRLFVTFGKERVKWGVSRFWNPTDFLNQEVLDPLAGVTLFDERLGVSLVKLHLPIESLGWNFYAVASMDRAFAPERVGGAVKAEFLVGQTEVSLSAAGKKDAPARIGATVSTGIGLVDLHVEAAVQHGSRAAFLRGTCDPRAAIAKANAGELPDTFLAAPSVDALPELGTRYSREEEWIPEVVTGAEIGVGYGDGDLVYVGAEYFYNATGYTSSAFYPCLLARGALTPFYLGRHYAAAYVLVPQPFLYNDTTIALSALANLSDASAVTRVDYRVRLLTFLDVNAFMSATFGQAGDEFTFALDLDAVELPAGLPTAIRERLAQDPALSLLSSGVHQPKPILQVGVGLSLTY